MIKLNDKNLSSSIKKDGLAGLYYVTGNDEFLIDRCIKKIIMSAGTDENELYQFDAMKSQDEELEQPFYTYSFSGNPRVIVFHNCQFGSLGKVRLELLSSLIKDIPENTTVIFKQFTEDSRFSISKKVESFVALCNNSATVECAAKKGFELENYIAVLIKNSGCTANDSVAKAIAELCGDDLMLISNEIEKLAAYCNYNEITKEQVDEICVRTAEAGVYDMITKIERKDIKGALLVLEDMLDNKNEPLMITAALNTAFINYYRAKLIKDNKLTEKSMFSLFDYKASDRKVSIAYERCSRFQRKQLEYLIEILYKLDLKLKSSSVDKRVLMEQHIAELCLAAGNGK